MVHARVAGPRRRTRPVLLASCLILASNAACAAIVTVGQSPGVASIADAARLARDGDVVEIPAGEYQGDVAVWMQKRLTIRGIGKTPVLKAAGRIAEGKAIFVFRDGEFVVENLSFEGARAPDRNGAGIRFERGRLTVRRCTSRRAMVSVTRRGHGTSRSGSSIRNSGRSTKSPTGRPSTGTRR